MLPFLLAVAAPAHATDVLVPDATPRSLDDFSVASLFYQMVVDAARSRGIDLEDADAIRKWAKAAADGCYDNDTCPQALWPLTDARLAVVLSVGKTPEGLDVDVRLLGADDPAPFKVIRRTVAAGQEEAFAQEVAATVADALPLFPARPKPLDMDEEELPPLEQPEEVVDEKPPEKPEKPPRPTKAELDAAQELPPRPDEPVKKLAADEERKEMGVPGRAYLAYKASKLSRADWLKRARVRSGRVFLELGGGWGVGDVDRGYGVRVGLVEQGDGQFAQEGLSQWSGDGAGQAPGFWAAVGYAPTWFLETSIAAGGQFGQKHLNTGWECDPDACDPATSEFSPPTVEALQLLVEPRVRILPLATGVVKPYVLAAFTLLYHDGFQVEDLEAVDYPDVEGGASFGVTGGLGVSIDAAAPFSIFAEVPATLLLSDGEYVATDPSLTQTPGRLEGNDTLVRFAGGITVRL